MIQASRLVFGFVGIFDQDEAERILEGQADTVASGTDLTPYTGGEASQEAKRMAPKLIARAEKAGAWQAAINYAAEHFSGFDLTYVTAEINQARQAKQAAVPVNAGASAVSGHEALAEAKKTLNPEPAEA